MMFRPTFPVLGGNVSKRTHFKNSETFQRFEQLRFPTSLIESTKWNLFCYKNAWTLMLILVEALTMIAIVSKLKW